MSVDEMLESIRGEHDVEVNGAVGGWSLRTAWRRDGRWSIYRESTLAKAVSRCYHGDRADASGSAS